MRRAKRLTPALVYPLYVYVYVSRRRGVARWRVDKNLTRCVSLTILVWTVLAVDRRSWPLYIA